MLWISAFGVLIFYSNHSVAESYKDLEFSIENGEATIIGNTGTNSELRIPEKIDKKPVTSIGTNDFMYNAKLTNVVIGKAVINVRGMVGLPLFEPEILITSSANFLAISASFKAYSSNNAKSDFIKPIIFSL
jgi:hypothetical protein